MEPIEVFSAQSGPYRLREWHYPAGFRLGIHAHDELQVSIILRGSMEETVRGTKAIASTGDLVAKPRGTEHENGFLTPGGVRVLCVATSDAHSMGAATRYVLEPRRGALACALRIRAGREDVSELLALLPAGELKRDCALVARAVARIEEGFDGPVSLASLAGALGVHRVHLARQFRLIRGCTVGEEIRATRVRRASDLIASTREPLAEIALKCGFADQAHMTRTFRAAAGVTPRAFRSLIRA